MARSRRARRRRGSSRPGGAAARWTLRAVAALLVLGVLGVLGGYFWLQSYLRSERFRLMVNSKVGEALEAEAGFSEFDWDGMEVRAPDFAARGEKMIRRIDLDGLGTEIKFAPLLGKRLETHEVRARRLYLELDLTKEGPQPQNGGSGSFTFSGVRVDELAGLLDFGSSALKWEGVTASLTPGPARGTYDATLTRGRLLTPIPLFGELSLQEAALRYGNKALFLQRGDWRVFEAGRLATYGEFDFGRGSYAVNCDLTGVQCQEVLPDDWQKRLRGHLTSEFAVQGTAREAPLITGSLDLEDGHLTALPILDRIAAYTSTERFRRLGLREARLNFRQQGDLLQLTDIEIASEGLLRIEGYLSIDDRRLEGEFQLGLTPATLAQIPGATERVFVPGRDGMHWTPVRITGTTGVPQEDLSKRLIAAGFEWMYEMVDGELVLKHSGEAAGELARSVWKTAGEAGRLGVGLLEQGTDIINRGRLPDPIDPIREGVGGVLDSILGNPGRRAREGEPPPKPNPAKELLEEQENEVREPSEAEDAPAPEAEDEAGENAHRPIEEQDRRAIPDKLRNLLDDELGVEKR